jgi:hypothetical protein
MAATTYTITPGRFSDDEEVSVSQVFPTAVTSAGSPGQVAFDTTHFYVCVAPDTWRRATLATW